MSKRKADKPLADWEIEKIKRAQKGAADLQEQGATLGEVFSYDPKTTDGAVAVSTYGGFVEARFKTQADRARGGTVRAERHAERNRQFREWAAEYRAGRARTYEYLTADWIKEECVPKKLAQLEESYKKTASDTAAKIKRDRKLWDIGIRRIMEMIARK